MSRPELSKRPTGRFPNAEAEAIMRLDYLSQKDSSLIRELNRQLDKRKVYHHRHNTLCNLLSLAYGIDVYNQISLYSLYPSSENPPIKIISDSPSSPLIYVRPDNPNVFVNTQSPDFPYEYFTHPLKKDYFEDDSKIRLPLYICHILDGLEEASHLHLQLLSRLHGSNKNSDSDHPHPQKLWKNSGNHPCVYRTKLWHEFAAITVQMMYANYYLSEDYPKAVSNLSHEYQILKEKRLRWVNSRSS